MTTHAPILITGADGQVGRALQTALAKVLPSEPVLALNRAQLDLAHAPALKQRVLPLRPRAIINAAAYTAVDKAESERELAFAINADAPRALAEAAKALAVPFIHYSTDYVFDGIARLTGDAPRPWQEDDSVAPLNVYGASKLAGEVAVRESGAAALTFRTSWVYAPYGKNFLLTMLKLGATRDQLSIVADQIGAPTTAEYIAETTTAILARALQMPDPCGFVAERTGVYHLTMGGSVSWFQFAEAIFSGAKRLSPGTKTPLLVPIPARDYPTPATRPQYSVLSNSKLKNTFGVEQPGWAEGLAKTLPVALSTSIS
jgi:dTDP-4-dehydrorhamnose reductase